MNWADGTVQITVNGKGLDGHCWGPPPDQAPTFVLLHEGLGSVGLWKDFPEQLAQATGMGVFAYSRAGHGHSDAAETPRPLNFMDMEAMQVLPQVLDVLGLQQGVLVGHSDGASIAAIYLGQVDDDRVTGACLIAPHFFTEPSGLRAIRKARDAFESGVLRDRLARHHHDPAHTFYGWNDVWLDPEFESWDIQVVIPAIRVPILAVQGRDDQYGTIAQIEALTGAMTAPLGVTLIADCKHSPHVEAQADLLGAIQTFVAP